jgi:hypothetical protein
VPALPSPSSHAETSLPSPPPSPSPPNPQVRRVVAVQHAPESSAVGKRAAAKKAADEDMVNIDDAFDDGPAMMGARGGRGAGGGGGRGGMGMDDDGGHMGQPMQARRPGQAMAADAHHGHHHVDHHLGRGLGAAIMGGGGVGGGYHDHMPMHQMQMQVARAGAGGGGVRGGAGAAGQGAKGAARGGGGAGGGAGGGGGGGGDDQEIYCLCKREAYGEMIACDNDNCAVEWFHLGCVGLSNANRPTGEWFCPNCKRHQRGGGGAPPGMLLPPGPHIGMRPMGMGGPMGMGMNPMMGEFFFGGGGRGDRRTPPHTPLTHLPPSPPPPLSQAPCPARATRPA